MSYIVWRDLLGMDENDPLKDRLDGLDDEIILRYQNGWAEDEFFPGATLKDAEEYYKERKQFFSAPDPSSFDTLLILARMIKEDPKILEVFNVQ